MSDQLHAAGNANKRKLKQPSVASFFTPVTGVSKKKKVEPRCLLLNGVWMYKCTFCTAVMIKQGLANHERKHITNGDTPLEQQTSQESSALVLCKAPIPVAASVPKAGSSNNLSQCQDIKEKQCKYCGFFIDTESGDENFEFHQQWHFGCNYKRLTLMADLEEIGNTKIVITGSLYSFFANASSIQYARDISLKIKLSNQRQGDDVVKVDNPVESATNPIGIKTFETVDDLTVAEHELYDSMHDSEDETFFSSSTNNSMEEEVDSEPEEEDGANNSDEGHELPSHINGLEYHETKLLVKDQQHQL